MMTDEEKIERRRAGQRAYAARRRAALTPEGRAAIARADKEYRVANRAKISQQRAQYRAANRERFRAYFLANIERYRRYSRKWYAKNRDRILVENRQIYRSDPEVRRRHAIASKAWREAHPDRMRELIAAWAKANPDRVRLLAARYRARHHDREIARFRARYSREAAVLKFLHEIGVIQTKADKRDPEIRTAAITYARELGLLSGVAQ